MPLGAGRTYGRQISERALEQEAARIFRRLIEADSYLARVGGYLDLREDYGVFVSRNKHKKPVLKLNAAMFAGFVSKDWIVVRDKERWQLSAAGQAWLYRRMATNDPFRAQHQLLGSKAIKIEVDVERKLTVNLGESPLGWLLQRKGRDGKPILSQEQYDAGERLRRDFEKAQMSPRITSDITIPMTSSSNKRAGDAGNGVAMQESAIAAKERFFSALDAVGSDLVEVLIEVCCYLKGMNEAEKQLHLPQRSGKIILQIALTRLGQHYGLIVADTAYRKKSPNLRHWGDKTYRPKI